MANQNKKLVILTIILIVFLAIAIGYIIYGFYSNTKIQKEMTTFQQGAQYGFEQAIIQISQQASACQQVPLFIQNQTINLVAVECLQAVPVQAPAA